VDADGVYQARIYTSPEKDGAQISFEADGKRLPIVARPQPNVSQIGSLFLAKGEHPLSLIALTSGQGIIDCVQLASVPRLSGAIEAEELKVVRGTDGAAAPQPSEPLDGVSAGRVLRFHYDRVGQGFVIDLGKRPALPYVLGVRPIVGPEAGVIQAFAEGKPIGPQFDLFAHKRELGGSVLPLGAVPAGVTAMEIRVVGKNAQSLGGSVELDYFRWEPAILGPGTAEGIWAQVVATHDCEYRPQDLGPDYSGGHQFWVQPCGLNGWVDIAIEIPSAGAYEIAAKYAKSWDYANIQAFLNGNAVGPVIDTYAPSVVPGETVVLAKQDLTLGRHILRFQAISHNPESKGYLMGIDHVVVKSN